MTSGGSPLPLKDMLKDEEYSGDMLNDFARIVEEKEKEKKQKRELNRMGTNNSTIYRLTLSPGVHYSYCILCDSIKPPRTHHCSLMGKCVLNFDHYCPWTANTIGLENYGYFLLFMFYLLLGCVYVLWTNVIYMQHYFTILSLSEEFDVADISLMHSPFDKDDENGKRWMNALYILAITLSASLSVLLMLIAHGYLIITNQTTVEYFTNKGVGDDYKRGEKEKTLFKNPFDKGWRENVKRVFGAQTSTAAVCFHVLLPTVLPIPSLDYPLWINDSYSDDKNDDGGRDGNEVSAGSEDDEKGGLFEDRRGIASTTSASEQDVLIKRSVVSKKV